MTWYVYIHIGPLGYILFGFTLVSSNCWFDWETDWLTVCLSVCRINVEVILHSKSWSVYYFSGQLGGKDRAVAKILSSPSRSVRRMELTSSQVSIVESPASAAATSVTLTSSVKMRKLSSGTLPLFSHCSFLSFCSFVLSCPFALSSPFVFFCTFVL